MHRNLKAYGDGAERSHVQEGVVATIWAALLLGMFTASLLTGHSETVRKADLVTASVGVHPR
jgi:hypothetical protein